MAKKCKTRASQRRPASLRPSVPQLVERADQHLASGRYREAIAGYKDLLKQDDVAAWRDNLASAYAGRARQLSAKGLLKEALVMWENRQQLGPAVPFEPEHAALLLQLGELPTVLRLYSSQASSLPPGALAELSSHLAARWLAGETQIAAGLPEEDPILVHGAAASEALAAYCRDDEPGLNAALSAIPFRSPYRDLAQILRALQRLPSRPREAAAMLSRGSVSAGFASLHEAAQLALAPEAELDARLAEAGETTRRFALALRGWDEVRQALWRELSKAKSSSQGLLRVMYAHRDRLGDAWVRQRGLRLLTEDFPRSLNWFQSVGMPRPTAAESDLIAAWEDEAAADPWERREAWLSHAWHLKQGGRPEPGSDRALRLALVLRRLDSATGIVERRSRGAVSEELARAVAQDLEESLAYDPDHLETYLRLIRLFLAEGSLKDARRILDQALARWPQDVKLLTAALDAAIATGAFKKATGLARQILKLDPINVGVRERLVSAHLAHARKQIRAARFDLARKELEQAAGWVNDERLRERCDLTSAFLLYGEDPEAGATRLCELAGRLGSGLSSAFAIALEAAAVGHETAPLLKRLGLAPRRAGRREDLLELFARLRAHLDADQRLPRDVGAYFERLLKDSGGASLSFQEVHAACETLSRAGLDAARLAFAKAALKRWRGAPIFELHAFEAGHPSGSRGGGLAALERLELALGRALEEGDNRTAHRIEERLRQAGEVFLGPPSPSPFDEISEEEMLSTFIRAMGANKLLDMLNLRPAERKKLKQIEREMGHEALLDALAAVVRDELKDSGAWDDMPPVPHLAPSRKSLNPAPDKGPVKRAKTAARDTDDPNEPDQLDFFS